MFGMGYTFAKIITDHSKTICHAAIAAWEVEATLAELRMHFPLLVQE